MRFQKKEKGEIISEADWYLSKIKILGVNNSNLWKDTDPDYEDYVIEMIQYFIKKGLAVEKEHFIQRCKCGATEINDDIIEEIVVGKLFSKKNDQLLCKLCLKPTEKTKVNSIFLPPSKKTEHDIPQRWLQKEAANSLDFENRVTRIREANFRIVAFSKEYYLDTDFFWSFFLAFLLEKEKTYAATLITSARTIKQAINVAKMTNAIIDKARITILAHPIIKIKTAEGLKKLNIEDFLKLADPKTLRFLLFQGLNWNNKESILESKQIYWIEHSLRPKTDIITDAKIDPLSSNFIKVCSTHTTNEVISKLRKNKELTNDELALYTLLS
jgi:hypothetical protein